jgi:hypothetical protein
MLLGFKKIGGNLSSRGADRIENESVDVRADLPATARLAPPNRVAAAAAPFADFLGTQCLCTGLSQSLS